MIYLCIFGLLYHVIVPELACLSEVRLLEVQETELPSPGDVIARFVRAIGGEARIRARKSVHLKADLQVRGQSWQLEVFRARPNYELERAYNNQGTEILAGHDEKGGWYLDPQTGPRLMEGMMLAERAHRADFDDLLRDLSKYDRVNTIAETEFEGTKCYKLEFVTKYGKVHYEFFDVDTGLLIGGISAGQSQSGEAHLLVRSQHDYKNFEGIRIPTRVVERIDDSIIRVVQITGLEWDAVDPDVFEPPESINELRRQPN